MPDANPGPSPNAPLRDASEGVPARWKPFPRGVEAPTQQPASELSSFVGREKELAEVERC